MHRTELTAETLTQYLEDLANGSDGNLAETARDLLPTAQNFIGEYRRAIDAARVLRLADLAVNDVLHDVAETAFEFCSFRLANVAHGATDIFDVRRLLRRIAQRAREDAAND